MAGDEMDQVVAELRAQFRAALPDHAKAIRKGWDTLGAALDAGPRGEAAKLLLHHVHRLAGAGGTLGFAAIGGAAATIEDRLRAVLEAGGPLTMPATLAPLLAQLLALCDAESGLSSS